MVARDAARKTTRHERAKAAGMRPPPPPLEATAGISNIVMREWESRCYISRRCATRSPSDKDGDGLAHSSGRITRSDVGRGADDRAGRAQSEDRRSAGDFVHRGCARMREKSCRQSQISIADAGSLPQNYPGGIERAAHHLRISHCEGVNDR